MLQIPLVEGINSTLETTIGGVQYTFTINWNDRFSYYSIDIKVSRIEVASGIVLVSGVDIASSSKIPLSRVYCINKNDTDRDMVYAGLGSDGLVVIIEDSDLEG
jgi:hypothetical protein